MDFITDFFGLTLKRKLFVIAAIGGWWFSIQFSKSGFDMKFASIGWMAWGLGFLVTILELALNDRDHQVTSTQVGLGILAYGYGILTNIIGIWAAGTGGQPFDIHDYGAWMAIVVGVILECVPEYLVMLAYGKAREADPLGVLSDLISGKLMKGSPKSQSQNQRQNNRPNNNSYRFSAETGPKTEPKIDFQHSASRHAENPRWQNGRKN